MWLPGPPDEPVEILRVMDLREVRGKKSEAEVKERLLQRVPEEISILLDWEGAVAREYALPDAEISVTVVDAAGGGCGTIEGPVTAEALSRVLELLSGALSQRK